MFQDGEMAFVLEHSDEAIGRTWTNVVFAAIANPACAFNDQLGIVGMGKDGDAWLDDFHLKSPGKRMQPEETSRKGLDKIFLVNELGRCGSNPRRCQYEPIR